MCHPRWSVRAGQSVFGNLVGIAYFPTIRGLPCPGFLALTGDPLLFKAILCAWPWLGKKSKEMNRVTAVAIANSVPDSGAIISGVHHGLLESEHAVIGRAGSTASSMAANFIPVQENKSCSQAEGPTEICPFPSGRAGSTTAIPLSPKTLPRPSLTVLPSLRSCQVLKPLSLLLSSSSFTANARTKGKNPSTEQARHCGC